MLAGLGTPPCATFPLPLLVAWSIQYLESIQLFSLRMSLELVWHHCHMWQCFHGRWGIQPRDTTATTDTTSYPQKVKCQVAFTLQTRFSPLAGSDGGWGLRCISVSLSSIYSDKSFHCCTDRHYSWLLVHLESVSRYYDNTQPWADVTDPSCYITT